jgi:hypothetical protein
MSTALVDSEGDDLTKRPRSTRAEDWWPSENDGLQVLRNGRVVLTGIAEAMDRHQGFIWL